MRPTLDASDRDPERRDLGLDSSDLGLDDCDQGLSGSDPGLGRRDQVRTPRTWVPTVANKVWTARIEIPAGANEVWTARTEVRIVGTGVAAFAILLRRTRIWVSTATN